MNRQIKFRVWAGSTMEYRVMAGYLGHFYCAGMSEKDAACLSEWNTIYGDATPVMQFTGLVDKNGVEIWEGDILKNFDFPVFFENGSFFVKIAYDSITIALHKLTEEIEVIGNIHQNPELLK